MMPSCDHTGTPRHFHSSTTSGSACLMISRTRASVAPRQSFSCLMRASISREADAVFCSFGDFSFVLVALRMCLLPPRSSQSFAGQGARLLHPVRELTFVELTLVNV